LAKNVEKRAGDRQRQYQGPHELDDFKPPKGRYDVREPKGPGNFILNNPRLRGTSRFEGAARGSQWVPRRKNHFRKKSAWGRIAAVSEIREEVPEAKFALGATLPPPRLP
jgi:hypothetical protein